jgi:Fe-S-cluster containining protein
MPSIETDLDHMADLAVRRQDEFEILRYTLEFIEDELPDEALDRLVEAIAAPVIAAIDCTRCANCCASLDVYLTGQNAEQLAIRLGIPLEHFIARYVSRESAVQAGEWGALHSKPCMFLDGRLCSVYPNRPDACRVYPALTPDFRWALEDIIQGARYCPIIYNVLDALIEALESRI